MTDIDDDEIVMTVNIRATELEQLQAERDSARREAGRLAQELVEVTGKLALAEVEVGRLREVAIEAKYNAQHLWGTLYRLIRSLDTNPYPVSEVVDRSRDVVEKLKACAQVDEALEPKEVTGG